jgi:hypothetical protein
MQPILPTPPGSILDLVARAWATGEAAAFAIRPTVRIGSTTLIPVAIDNGNDALKGAVLRRDQALPEGEGLRSLLTTVRVPTAFALAQTIQGRQEVTYTCDGISFWVGDVALAHGGDALRLGPTLQRLDDQRQHWFIGAGIVELLRAAGYPPGEHQIALTLAVPNTEIVIEHDERGVEQLTLDRRTRESLAHHLKGKLWTISRVDDGSQDEAKPLQQPETWTMRLRLGAKRHQGHDRTAPGSKYGNRGCAHSCPEWKVGQRYRWPTSSRYRRWRPARVRSDIQPGADDESAFR